MTQFLPANAFTFDRGQKLRLGSLLGRGGMAEVYRIAKAVQATHATRSGTPKGKPSYMSPEQITGAPDLDGRTDLFAVGVTLWELLAGRRMIVAETAEGLFSDMRRVAKEIAPVPELSALHPRVPRDLLVLIHDLLAIDRDARPRDAAAALARLRPWVPPDGIEQLRALLTQRFGGRGAWATTGPPTSPTVSTLPAGGQTTAASMDELGSPVGARRSVGRRFALAIGAAGLGAIAIAAGMATTGHSSSRAVETTRDAAPDVAQTPPLVVDAGDVQVPSASDVRPDAVAEAPTVDAGVAVSATSARRRSRRPVPAPAVDAGRRIIETKLRGGE